MDSLGDLRCAGEETGSESLNILQRIGAGLKAFQMRFSGGSGSWPMWTFAGPQSFDYRSTIGNGADSSIVQASIGWLTRTFPESPIILEQDTPDGPKQILVHDAIRLINRPNPYYSGKHLWAGTIADYTTEGNAYWIKYRSGTRKVVQLWWVPQSLMEPKWPDNGLEYISHYEYKPDGVTPYRVEVADVVHFRNGFDPDNMRKGRSPLRSLLLEIFTDEEAAQFTASVLRNLGVPGVLISPGDDAELSTEDAEALKEQFKYRFNNERRGEPMVLSSKAQVSVLSFSPQQMNLRELRKIPEERITAVIGISPMVLGLGAGLDHSTYSNYEEARLAAYESNIIPNQSLFGAELDLQYLPDFVPDEDTHVRWDNSGVRVLQDDEGAKVMRAMAKLAGGAIKLNEARAEMGHPELPDGDLFYIPMSVEIVPEDEMIKPEPDPIVPPARAAALPSGSDNGDNADLQRQDNSTPVEQLSARQVIQTKRAVRGVVRGVQRVRKRVTPAASRAMSRFFDGQLKRVLAELENQSKADLIDTDIENIELTRTLNPYYIRVLDGVHDVTTSALDVSFDLDDPITRAYLDLAGTRIRDINETTLKHVRQELQQGQALGESQSTLANRLRAMPDFSKNRANTVARTEMGHSSNQAAFTNYRGSGVVAGVEVDDGDDDEECASMHGRRFSMDEVDNVETLAHPNCVRAFLPLTDVEDLDDRRGNIIEGDE